MRDKHSDFRVGIYRLRKYPNSSNWYIAWPEGRKTGRKSTGTSDLQEAQLILVQYVATVGQVATTDPSQVYIENAFDRYYENHGKLLRTAADAQSALGRWADFFPGALVSEITYQRQEAFIAHLRARGLGNGSIRRILAVGQAALNWARKRGELTGGPIIALSLAPEAPPRERFLDLDEVRALLAANKPPHLQTYLILAIATGARPEALLELRHDQLDFHRLLIKLNPDGRPQNKKRRPTIPMLKLLVPMLTGLPNGPLVAFNGKAFKSIKKSFRVARIEAGLDSSVTPYTIRHTVASEKRMRGVPMGEVATWLGHSTGYRTTERYQKILAPTTFRRQSGPWRPISPI